MKPVPLPSTQTSGLAALRGCPARCFQLEGNPRAEI